jgi:hypothetical protein
MPRFLIEVPHAPTTEECNRTIAVFLRTGSHFLTHADWGCKDEIHKAWFIAEVDTRQEALAIVPPEYRGAAHVVMLTRFTPEDLDRIPQRHGGNRAPASG